MTIPFLLVYGGGDEGGAVEYLFHLLAHVDRDQYQPIFVSMGRDSLRGQVERLGVEYRVASSPRAVARIARTSAARFVHTHGVRANFAGRLAGIFAKVPSITTVHSMIAMDYTAVSARIVSTLMDNTTMPLAKRVIAISEAIAQDVIKRGAKPERVRIVHNGIPAAPPGDRDAIRRELGLASDVSALITVARLHPVKGINYLLDAVAIAASERPLCLCVVGDGPSREELQEHAVRLGLGPDRVKFLGYLPGARRLLPGFDLYVSPSLMEGLGISVIEAMAAGVPVVASAVGGVTELVEHDRTGLLVPPEDAKALALAIHRALSDRVLAERLSAAAYQRYRSNFTVEQFVRNTEAVYTEVLREDKNG